MTFCVQKHLYKVLPSVKQSSKRKLLDPGFPRQDRGLRTAQMIFIFNNTVSNNIPLSFLNVALSIQNQHQPVLLC
jgi:hypothetical protein